MSDIAERTFERQDPMADANLIDPGPIPGVGARGTYQRQLEKALATKVTPMREGVRK